jgi:hypothetical protein
MVTWAVAERTSNGRSENADKRRTIWLCIGCLGTALTLQQSPFVARVFSGER